MSIIFSCSCADLPGGPVPILAMCSCGSMSIIFSCSCADLPGGPVPILVMCSCGSMSIIFSCSCADLPGWPVCILTMCLNGLKSILFSLGADIIQSVDPAPVQSDPDLFQLLGSKIVGPSESGPILPDLPVGILGLCLNGLKSILFSLGADIIQSVDP